jgi:hypothetical protein
MNAREYWRVAGLPLAQVAADRKRADPLDPRLREMGLSQRAVQQWVAGAATQQSSVFTVRRRGALPTAPRAGLGVMGRAGALSRGGFRAVRAPSSV